MIVKNNLIHRLTTNIGGQQSTLYKVPCDRAAGAACTTHRAHRTLFHIALFSSCKRKTGFKQQFFMRFARIGL